jgi:hypothetical protein
MKSGLQTWFESRPEKQLTELLSQFFPPLGHTVLHGEKNKEERNNISLIIFGYAHTVTTEH